MTRVFISFATPDLGSATDLLRGLRDAGHEVFLDRDLVTGIGVGEDWKQRLFRELREVDAVVAVVTAAHVASTWCTAEIAIADALGCRLLPVRVEPGVVHPLMELLQYADWSADPGRAVAQLDQALGVLPGRNGRGWLDTDNPFPGLEPFTAELAPVFHGRVAETRELVHQLGSTGHRSGGLLAIVGPSGCGKSSLLAAGLLTALERDPRWVTAPLWTPGRDPLAGLARSLTVAGNARGLDWTAPGLRAELDRDPGALAELADQLLAAELRSDRPRLLLPVDQGEELFTRASARIREQLAAGLAAACAGPVQVVTALRSEFVNDLRGLPQLAGVPMDAYLLAPLSADLLPTVVEGPARTAGLRWESELVPRLVSDTGTGEALPLLAFTLRELARGVPRGGLLTMERYQALGGVRGALARHADQALDTAVHQGGLDRDAVLAGLARMVTIDDTGRRARRRLRLAGLPGPLRSPLQVLVDARLLVTELTDDEPTVGVVHEALLTAWPPLDSAITERTDALRAARAAEQAAAEWRRAGLDEGYLWAGERLSRARAPLNGPSDRPLVDLEPDVQAFLDASEKFDDRIRTAARTRRRWGVAGLSLLLVLALIVAVMAVRQADTARTAARTAAARDLLGRSIELSGSDARMALRFGIAAAALDPGRTADNTLLAVLQTTGEYRSTVSDHTRSVQAVAFSPDGTVLASAGADRTVRLTDVRERTRPRALGAALGGHNDSIWALAFSRNGRLLATGSEDGTARLWDVTDPARAHPFGSALSAGAAVSAVAFGPTGELFVGTDAGAVLRHQPTGAQPLELARDSSRHSDRVFALTVSQDGRVLASAGRDGQVLLWDIGGPAQLRPLGPGPPVGADQRLHPGGATSVVFDPFRPNLLASAGADGTVRYTDITDSAAPRPFDEPVVDSFSLFRQIAITRIRDRVLLAAAGTNQRTALVDVTDPAAPRLIGEYRAQQGTVQAVAFAADGSTMATGSGDATVVLWDMGDPGYLARPVVETGYPAPAGLAPGLGFAGPEPTLLAATASGAERIGSPDPPDPSRPAAPAAGVAASAFARDVPLLVTADLDGGLRVTDLADPARPSPRWSGPALQGGAIRALALSGDGRLLATGGPDGSIALRGLDDPTRPAPPVPMGGLLAVDALAFTPDGRTLITSAGEGAVTVWDVSDRARPRLLGETMNEHDETVLTIDVAPDGRTFATGSTDRSVLLWDLTDREHPRALGEPVYAHDYGVLAVRFGADGQTMITSGRDNSVRLWDIADPAHPDELGILFIGPTEAPSLTLGRSGSLLAIGDTAGRATVLELPELGGLREGALRDACARAGALTEQEWATAIPDLPYEATCPE